MDLDEILGSFVSLTDDAVAIGFRDVRDAAARIVWLNDAFHKAFGYSEEECIGLTTDTFICPDHFPTFIEKIRPRLESGAKGFVEETLCRRKDGTTFWSSLSVSFLPEDEQGRHYSFGVYRNLSALKARERAAERALAEREALNADLQRTQDRLLSAINAFPDPFAIFDRQNQLVLWNKSYAEATTDEPDAIRTGMAIEDVLRLAIGSGRFPGALGREDDWLNERRSEWLEKRDPVQMEMEGDQYFRVVRSVVPNGDTVVLRINISEIVKKEQELQGYAARLEEANREISEMALLDDLTGLGNRRYLSAEFERMRERRRATGGEITALHIDLDRFKQINDTIGHAAGDHVLRKVAERLKAAVRTQDIVARIGGDEFVVLMLHEKDSDWPERLSCRIVDDMSRPVSWKGKECRFGASIGMACTPVSDEAGLLTGSDIALYKAKHSGRGRVMSFDAADLREMKESRQLADQILVALERSEFIPFYQPQIDAKTGALVGLEALARWKHPERGILRPFDFLATAEDLGVVGQIDGMIYDKAIRECVNHFALTAQVPSLSFNVSGKRILEDNILSAVDRAREYPGTVVFELLETIYVEEESDHFFHQIDRLRDGGIDFEVDDFGSGRASLIALQRIAPDRLKIDRRLVQPLLAYYSARQLVASIIGIGETMGIEVTAEGVETEEHARILADLGCDRLQGYHFSAPLPLAQLASLFPTEPGGQSATG